MDKDMSQKTERLLFNNGVIKDRSYDFILQTAESLLDIFRNCGKYCDKFEIEKVTDGDGRIYYALKWW